MTDQVYEWQCAIRTSTVVTLLKTGQSLPQNVVLVIEDRTNELLEWKFPSTTPSQQNSLFFKSRDDFLLEIIATFDDFWFDRVAAIISCLDALTDSPARALVYSAIPEVDRLDPGSHYFLRAYLECVAQAAIIRRGGFSDSESVAATTLQQVLVSERTGSPRFYGLVWKFLHTIGHSPYLRVTDDFQYGDANNGFPNGVAKNLLPNRFVFQILTHDMGRGLEKTLQHHRLHKRWWEAYNIVYGMRKVHDLDRPKHILETIFPDYLKWAVWSPNGDRLKLWSTSTNPTLATHREKLAPYFALEGPDDDEREPKATLRASGHTQYFDILIRVGDNDEMNRGRMLDRLLLDLDAAIKQGPSALELFIRLCLAGSQNPVTNQVRRRLEVALRLGHNDYCQQLIRYLEIVRDGGFNIKLYDSIVTVSKVLPILRISHRMQDRWGTDLGIERLGRRLFRQGQTMLLSELPRGQKAVALARAVGALGSELLSSSWMHKLWSVEFQECLKHMPTDARIQQAFTDIARAPTTEFRDSVVSFLTNSLCWEEDTLYRRSSAPIPQRHSSSSSAASSIGVNSNGPPTSRRAHSVRSSRGSEFEYDPFDAEIWHRPGLRLSQQNFRQLVRQVDGVPPDVATRCAHQSLQERDEHLTQMSQWISGDITDWGCIELTNLLVGLVAGRTHQRHNPCWGELLLHLIKLLNRRRRPDDGGVLPGLLDRLVHAEFLTLAHFQTWIQSLHLVLGDADLMHAAEEVGFTSAKINECAARIEARETRSVAVEIGSSFTPEPFSPATMSRPPRQPPPPMTVSVPPPPQSSRLSCDMDSPQIDEVIHSPFSTRENGTSTPGTTPGLPVGDKFPNLPPPGWQVGDTPPSRDAISLPGEDVRPGSSTYFGAWKGPEERAHHSSSPAASPWPGKTVSRPFSARGDFGGRPAGNAAVDQDSKRTPDGASGTVPCDTGPPGYEEPPGGRRRVIMEKKTPTSPLLRVESFSRTRPEPSDASLSSGSSDYVPGL